MTQRHVIATNQHECSYQRESIVKLNRRKVFVKTSMKFILIHGNWAICKVQSILCVRKVVCSKRLTLFWYILNWNDNKMYKSFVSLLTNGSAKNAHNFDGITPSSSPRISFNNRIWLMQVHLPGIKNAKCRIKKNIFPLVQSENKVFIKLVIFFLSLYFIPFLML